MTAFLQGILMGLAITISFGPGFMALFQTSIVRGIRAGFVLATGILISDLVLIGISYFGVSRLFHPQYTIIFGVVASLILVITGGISLIRKPQVDLEHPRQIIKVGNSLIILLIRGFLLNIVNPFSLIFWIGIMGIAVENYGMNQPGFFIFFTGLILTAFTSDLGKCYLSGRLRRILTHKIILILSNIMGMALITIGIFIFCKVLFFPG